MEQLTALYQEASELISEAQDRMELVQEWAEASNHRGALHVLEDSMTALTSAYLKLYGAEQHHKELAQTLEEIKEADSKRFLELVGGKTFYGDPQERSLKQYVIDTIAPWSNYTEEDKESCLSSYIYRVVRRDLVAFNQGKPSVAKVFAPEVAHD